MEALRILEAAALCLPPMVDLALYGYVMSTAKISELRKKRYTQGDIRKFRNLSYIGGRFSHFWVHAFLLHPLLVSCLISVMVFIEIAMIHDRVADMLTALILGSLVWHVWRIFVMRRMGL